MVTYQPSDLIPMGDFPLAWRISDARWASLPERVLDRIKPFTPDKSKALLAGSRRTFDPHGYRATHQVSLEENSHADGERIRQWLRKLPITPDQQVYLCWQTEDNIAAATDWGTFAEVWDDLWYPFDRLLVFDETYDWALVLGPEEQAQWIERGSPRA